MKVEKAEAFRRGEIAPAIPIFKIGIVKHSYYIIMLKGFGVSPTKNPIVHLRSKCSMGDFSLLYKSSKLWYDSSEEKREVREIYGRVFGQ